MLKQYKLDMAIRATDYSCWEAMAALPLQVFERPEHNHTTKKTHHSQNKLQQILQLQRYHQGQLLISG